MLVIVTLQRHWLRMNGMERPQLLAPLIFSARFMRLLAELSREERPAATLLRLWVLETRLGQQLQHSTIIGANIVLWLQHSHEAMRRAYFSRPKKA